MPRPRHRPGGHEGSSTTFRLACNNIHEVLADRQAASRLPQNKETRAAVFEEQSVVSSAEPQSEEVVLATR